MEYWSGKFITSLKDNEVFVFGSNPEGRHGAGAAKAALAFGAKYKTPRGLMGKSYGLVTKNLTAGYTEIKTGIVYPQEGERSVSPQMIRSNIDELYALASQPEHQNTRFLITYQYETYPNGTPKRSLNGYDSQEMLEMFVRPHIPPNIVFHDSYERHLTQALDKAASNKGHKEIGIPAPDATYTYFFHLSSPFSNFHPARFDYKEYTFISNEQFMMFSKAKTFKDEVAAEKIMAFNATPIARDFIEGKITREQIIANPDWSDVWNKMMISIKKEGRDVKNYDEDVWVQKRPKIVLFGARLKFSQNTDLKDILMATGTTLMVEASRYDTIWGIGLDEKTARKTPPEQWPGQNLLGKDLDILKSEFRQQLVDTPAATSRNKP